MRDETSLLNPRNANPKLSAVVRDVKQRMWPDRVFSPDGAQPRQDLCLRSVSTILNRDLSSYLDEKVVEHHWRCRLPRRFHALLAQPEVCSCRVTGSLAELFDCLSARAENRRLKQLGNIYHRRLLPLIGRYFEARARAQLEESLKTLMLFQYLDMPYRGYDMGRDPTSSGVLMMKLHMLCGGRGLMTWREDATVLFAIEGDRERFVTWVMGRMCCFEDRDARCKVLSDALWSTLFAEAHNDTLDERCVWMESGRSSSISGAQFPTRDAISIHIRGNGSDVPHTVVFESPWMQDRGCRLQRTLRALPHQASTSHISVWEPHPLDADARARLQRHLAAGKALRYALEQQRLGFQRPWLVHALHRTYSETAPDALHLLIESYRQGRVVTDTEVLRPVPDDKDLLRTLTLVVNAVSCQDDGRAAALIL